MADAGRPINVQAERLLAESLRVAEHLDTSAKQPTAAAPHVAAPAAPVDAAASQAAAAMRAKMAQMSAELATKGPATQQAAAAAATSLQAQDAANVARLPSVPSPPSGGSGRSGVASGVRMLSSGFGMAPPPLAPGQQPQPPPPQPAPPPPHPSGPPPNPPYTRSPLTDPVVAADPSVIARQAEKVAEARRALDAAQAKLDAAAREAYTKGPGAGPGRDVTDPLSQAVFDARRTLTEQSAILDELNKSAAATGAAQPIPTPPLPPNAGVQAFPPEPSVASQAAKGLTDASHDINKATFGLVPDVAKDLRTFGNWGEAGSGDRADALLDSASLIPGGKLLGEAHHGLGALADAVRHGDDIPTPHLDVPGVDHGLVGDSGGDMPYIDMNMKDGWSDFQQFSMRDKVGQFNDALGDQGFSQVPPVPRDPAVRQDFLESLGLERVPPGFHVDHTLDLQAGGTDTLDNMGLLDGSVNSSFGSQLNKGMNRFPPDTVFGGVRLPDP
jgi:hypothetical protein